MVPFVLLFDSSAPRRCPLHALLFNKRSTSTPCLRMNKRPTLAFGARTKSFGFMYRQALPLSYFRLPTGENPSHLSSQQQENTLPAKRAPL